MKERASLETGLETIKPPLLSGSPPVTGASPLGAAIGRPARRAASPIAAYLALGALLVWAGTSSSFTTWSAARGHLGDRDSAVQLAELPWLFDAALQPSFADACGCVDKRRSHHIVWRSWHTRGHLPVILGFLNC